MRRLILACLCSGCCFAQTLSTPALIRAIESRSAAEWRPVLERRADVQARDGLGNTALHLAALNHDLAAVEALLAAGAEADAANTAQATPLLYGAGHPGIVRALLAKGANVNATSQLLVTPLLVAVAHPSGHEAVQRLIEAGADLNAKDRAGVESALLRAVRGGDPRTIDLLLELGAAQRPRGAAAALSVAAIQGQRALVERLLTLGADPNLDPAFAGHALNNALLGEHLSVAELLIERGADLTLASPDGHGTPPMVWSAYNQTGDDRVARRLLERGVDPDQSNLHGATALTWALRTGPTTPLVAMLREKGAHASLTARVKPVPSRSVPEDPAARRQLIRERLPVTLALLQRSSEAFLDNGFVQRARCTSCHGQDLPALAYAIARERGFSLDDAAMGRQLEAQLKRWDERAEYARQMSPPVGGAPVALAYGFFGLKALGHPLAPGAEAMIRYILRTQQTEGAWNDFIRRPPMEDGQLVSTAWVALAVRDFPLAGYEQERAESQQRSARWLAAQTARSQNEMIFQLLGLHWSGVSRDRLAPWIKPLLNTQRADGGWAQLPALESDAWATGTALYALHEAGGMNVSDPVYQRGVAFLLRTQFEDGSWWVKGRSWPFQPHFNGQFPHGKDQWISQASTAIAAVALGLVLDPVKPSSPLRTGPELVAVHAATGAVRAKTPAGVASSNAGAVDFNRDIRPLFERSCAGCHRGEKARGGLALASRESLLKGGASGEPAITPGYAEDSALIQYVLGRIEDLEMPPLSHREKYPPLTSAEVDQLRAWIDAGAPWSGGEAVPAGRVRAGD